MDHVDTWAIYYLGERLTTLRCEIQKKRDVKEEEKAAGRKHIAWVCAIVSSAVRAFATGNFIPLDGPSESGIKRKAEFLLHQIHTIGRLWNSNTLLPSDLDIAALEMAIDELESTLRLDSPRINLYFVPQRLAYDTSTLLDTAERAIPKQLLQFVPSPAVEDIRQAGRCFAFLLPTATAFHILRATETVMVAYLKALGLTVPENSSWAGYIKALGTVPTLPKRMIARLDKLRDYERNEIMHPEKFLDPDDAADLFDYAKSAIIAMATDIGARQGYVHGA